MSRSSASVRAFRRRRRREKLPTLLVAETIIFELQEFLEAYRDGTRSGSLLDIGAGSRPYAPLYEPHFERCVSTDVSTSGHDISEIDVIAPAEELPFFDASFDAVLCTEVLEHCSDPGAAMREIARVLRPGGRAFLSTPFMTQLHEMPFDYHRFTPSALEKLALDQGLAIESLRPRGDYFALALLIALYPLTKILNKATAISRVPLNDARNPIVWIAIVLPQRLYFALWRRARSGRAPRIARAHERLSHFALGYTTVVHRP